MDAITSTAPSEAVVPSQHEIARILGVHQPTVARWFSGVCVPQDRYLYHLAEIMGMTPEALLLDFRRRRADRRARISA